MIPEHLEVDLGEWKCGGREYRLRLIVQKHLLTRFFTRAINSRYGRAALEAGGITLLVRRIVPRAAEGASEGQSELPKGDGAA